MMKHPIRPELSLRVKLILSYLGVALGAILILAIVVSIAVQNYFASTEQNLLRAHAVYEAQYIEYQYRALGSSWDRVSPERIQTSDPVLLIVTDTNNAQLLCRQPAFLSLDCDDPALKQALVQALQCQSSNFYYWSRRCLYCSCLQYATGETLNTPARVIDGGCRANEKRQLLPARHPPKEQR